MVAVVRDVRWWQDTAATRTLCTQFDSGEGSAGSSMKAVVWIDEGGVMLRDSENFSPPCKLPHEESVWHARERDVRPIAATQLLRGE